MEDAALSEKFSVASASFSFVISCLSVQNLIYYTKYISCPWHMPWKIDVHPLCSGAYLP